MKLSFTISILLVFVSLAHSQTYIKAVRGTVYSNARRLIRTQDGGWLIAGVAGESSGDISTQDFYAVKFGPGGRQQWAGRYGTAGVYEEATSAIETKDKGYLLSGFSTDASNKRIGALVKIDSAGNKTWSKTFAGAFPLAIVSSVQTADSGYVAGATYTVNGTAQPLLIKLSATGAVTAYLKPNAPAAAANLRKMITADNGDVVMLLDETASGNKKLIVERVTAGGAVIWAKRFGGTHAEFGSDLIETRNKDFALTGGNSNGSNGTTYMATMVRLDGNGNVKWYRSLNTDLSGSVTVSGYSLLENGDGSLVACGTVYRDLAPGSLNIYLLRYASTGAYLSSSYIGLPNSSNGNDDYGRGIIKVNDGYLLASTSLAYGYSAVVLKGDTSFTFCLPATPIAPARQDTAFVQSNLSLSFSLQPGITDTDALSSFAITAGLQNECSTSAATISVAAGAAPAHPLTVYPNPAVGVLNLTFTGSRAEKGLIQVYDIAGNRYLQLPVAVAAGENSTRIDVSSLRSGHYKILLSCSGGLLTAPFYKQ